MKRKIIAAAAAAALSMLCTMTVFAGQWQQDSKGWWYSYDNSGYAAGKWEEINGKSYYFDNSGYMLSNTTTPDGYLVGPDGAWIKNNQQQTAKASKPVSQMTKNEVIQALNAHFTSTATADGNYVVFELYDKSGKFVGPLRYQISDSAAQALIARGGTPSANRLVGTISVDKKTGKVWESEFNSIEPWYIQ